MHFSKQIIYALYSPTFIRNFRFQKVGKTIFYIFLLSFLSILPLSIHLVFNIKEILEFTPEVLNEFISSNGMFLSTSYTIDQALPFLLPILLMVLLFFSFVSYFFIVLFLSLLSYILMIKQSIPYKQLFTVSAYCLTFPTILFIVFDFLNVPKPTSLFMIVSIVIILLTLKTFPKRKKA